MLLFVILWRANPASAEPTQQICGAVSITEPAEFQLSTARPQIAWLPVPGARAYRVKVDSRVPQGEKVFTLDTEVTSPSFLPASPLAEQRAKVRVEITPVCQAGPGTPALLQFYIDTSPACGQVADLRVEVDNGKRNLIWHGPSTATRYSLWVYTLDKGRLLAKAELREAPWELPEDLRGPAMVSLKPYCPPGQGAFSFLAL